jgi:hypothetical protein
MPNLMHASGASFHAEPFLWIAASIIASILSIWLAVITPVPRLLEMGNTQKSKQNAGTSEELSRPQAVLVICIVGTCLISTMFMCFWGLFGDTIGNSLGVRGFIQQSGDFAFKPVAPPNTAETIVDIISLWWLIEGFVGLYLVGPIHAIVYQLRKPKKP